MASHNEEIVAWLRGIASVLGAITDGFEARYGYPPDENVITKAVDNEAVSMLSALSVVPVELVEFYGHVAEISAPDVGVGHFIHPAEQILGACHELSRVTGRLSDTVVVFGSDGGGNHIASSRTCGRIYFLPHEATVVDGVYQSSDPEFRVVASDLDEFRKKLLAGFTSFLSSGTARMF